MQAAYIEKYGSKEKLVFGDLPVPGVNDYDVLCQIYSASLNPIDFKVRDGLVKILRKQNFPLVLGHDFAGVVTAIGPKVTKYKIGDKVFSRPANERMGTLAEFISVDQSELSPMPKNLSFSEAASLPLVGLTSWQALVSVAHIKAGDRVFIQAGSGGVGSFAIQLAKNFGAYVITSTSQKNIEFVKRLGADEVIDYKTQRFEDILKNIDIVFDTLGKEDLYKSFAIVKPGSRVVSISGDPDGNTAKRMKLGFIKTLLLKMVGRKANALAKKAGARYSFIFMESRGNDLKKIKDLVEAGKIKPVIDHEFTLNESQTALDYIESGRVRGKVVVKIKS